jgi:hypothetical protein
MVPLKVLIALQVTWANANGIEEIACPADWKRHGRGAGPTSNKLMLEEHQPDLVVAFPGGKGTAHMVGLAEKAGTKVVFAKPGLTVTSDSFSHIR